MIPTFSTNAIRSLGQWLDNYILQEGQAFINNTSRLRYQYDPRLGTGYSTFVAPFRSLVFDSGVSGASIFNSASGYFFNASDYTSSTGTPPYSSVVFPQVSIGDASYTPVEINFGTGTYITIISGVAIISGNSVFFPDNLSQTGAVRISGQSSSDYSDIIFSTDGSPTQIIRNQQGAKTDFVNGRLIVPSSLVPSSAVLSGSFAFKEFNIYYANQLQEGTIFTNKYYLNSKFDRRTSPPPDTYSFGVPCVFISNMGSENKNFGIGGKYRTAFNIRLNVVAETSYQLENALSLLCDSKHKTFPIVSRADSPLNFYGDYKSGYNYETLEAQYSSSVPMIISSARSFKISDSTKANESLFFGGVDLTIETSRNIR